MTSECNDRDHLDCPTPTILAMTINILRDYKIDYTNRVSDSVDSFSIDTFIKSGIVALFTVCKLVT